MRGAAAEVRTRAKLTHGLALWAAHDFRLVPYSQLIRSAEEGALVGDPRRLFLIRRETAGNGIAAAWPDLLEALDIAWEVVKGLGVVGAAAVGAKVMLDPIRNRLRHGRDVLGRHAVRWEQRGAWPYSFVDFLGERAWASETLARLLGCSKDEAEAVLELFRFAYSDDDNRWHYVGDEPAKVMKALIEEAQALHEDVAPDAKSEFPKRIEQLVQTGEPPQRAPVLPPELDDTYWKAFESRERAKKGLVTAAIAGVGLAGGLLLGRLRRSQWPGPAAGRPVSPASGPNRVQQKIAGRDRSRSPKPDPPSNGSYD